MKNSYLLLLASFACAQTVVHFKSTTGFAKVHTPLYRLIPAGKVGPEIPQGETPASIACIYGVVPPTEGCPVTGALIPTGGSGAIAVLEYGSNSTMQSDAALFSATFGLPAPNITEVCALGAGQCPYNDQTGWDVETALDVQWAHAMAPNARIYVVEFVNDPLGDGAETAAAQLVSVAGGGEVSNSWGYNGGESWCGEGACELEYDSYFVYPGVVFFASAGDHGAEPEYPSVSPGVVSAGGTYVVRNNKGLYKGTEECWAGSGGGESVYEPIPTYQNVISGIVGGFRGTPDLAADADPYSGVAVYNTTSCGGWCIIGGTSVASPVLAGIANAAGGFQSSTLDELAKVYGEYRNAKEYKADFHDVTVGYNGEPARKGWDYCTGVGTPRTEKAE